MTAAMVIEERKRVAVASSIKAGLTDVGHQSFFAPVHVCVYACTCLGAHVHQKEKSVLCICIQKGEAAGCNAFEAVT